MNYRHNLYIIKLKFIFLVQQNYKQREVFVTIWIFRYAQYSHFKIYSEAEYYKLEIDGYEGTAGDSLNDPWYGSNNSPFSTYNR